MERAKATDPDADPAPDGAVQALAMYEAELKTALDRNDDGEGYRAIFWTYYLDLVGALDATARSNGWPFVKDLVDAYDHRTAGTLSDGTAVIANVVGRYGVRLRLSEGAAAVPGEAIEYLGSIPMYASESTEISWEESQHVGWGIGHPTVSAPALIREQLGSEDTWAAGAALDALYIDQHAAVDVVIDVLQGVEDGTFLMDQLSRFEGEPSRELFPRGSDFIAEFDQAFEFPFAFDPDVEAALKAAVAEYGFGAERGEDWRLADLEVGWGP